MSLDVYSATSDYLTSYLATAGQTPPGGIYLAQIPEDHAGSFPCIVINDLGFETEWTFENGFHDVGALRIDCYAISAAATRVLGDLIKTAFANPTTWATFSAFLPSGQTARLYQRRRFQIAAEDVRGPDGSLLYRYETEFDIRIEGNY